MKKIVLCLSLLSVLIIGFLIIDATYVRVNYASPDRMLFARDFFELQEVSDVIVKAQVLPDQQNFVYDDDGYGVTFTKILVHDVFKGDVFKGDILPITEEYYYTDDTIGKTLWLTDHYVPARVGQVYVFFLMKYQQSKVFDGMYSIVDLEYGKYLICDKVTPANVKALSGKVIELCEGHYSNFRDKNNQYRDWYKLVLELYN